MLFNDTKVWCFIAWKNTFVWYSIPILNQRVHKEKWFIYYVHRNFIWKRSKTQHQIIRVRYNTIQKTRKILTNKLHETSLLSPFMSFATSNMTVIKRLIRPPIKRKSSVNVYGLLCRLWMYWLWQHHLWKNEIKSKSIMISLKFVWILLIVRYIVIFYKSSFQYNI